MCTGPRAEPKVQKGSTHKRSGLRGRNTPESIIGSLGHQSGSVVQIRSLEKVIPESRTLCKQLALQDSIACGGSRFLLL